MIIKSKLTEKDFINVNFVLLYSKTFMKVFTGIICFFLFISILTVGVYPVVVPPTQILTLTAMLSVVPLMTYFVAKKNYTTNERISETIEYQFDKDYLLIKGESFNSQLTWNKVYKVTQTKNWLLIWQNRQIASPIPKRDIWERQLEDLKKILQEHNVKNNL